ncbi:MAG: heme exporter protein CcmB [Candidatus Marinimicrobia bacterium]|nr:heme exporter protein CcmB [Candidatus Neomarinimicrobiota bacterium]
MFITLLKKDLLLELRSKEIIISMLTFGVTVILTFAFSFNVSPDIMSTFAPGLFWIMILFISVLGLQRSFAYEKEFDAYSLMLTSPVDRGFIFLSKWMSGTLFLIITECAVALPFVLFLQLNIDVDLIQLFGVIVLGDLGIMVGGSLVSGLAMRAKMSAVLLPILMFPIVSPVLIAAVKSTVGLLNHDPFVDWQLWIRIMGSFTVIFALIGYTLYDHISEE